MAPNLWFTKTQKFRIPSEIFSQQVNLAERSPILVIVAWLGYAGIVEYIRTVVAVVSTRERRGGALVWQMDRSDRSDLVRWLACYRSRALHPT